MKKRYAALTAALSAAILMCAGLASVHAAETDAPKLLVTSYKMETEDRIQREGEEDTFPYARITWTETELTEESAVIFPELAGALKKRSADTGKKAAEVLAEGWKLAEESEGGIFTSNEENWSDIVVRADSRAVNILTAKDLYYNGPHPFSWCESVMYDTKTGEMVPLSDVINGVANMKALPGYILDHLSAIDDSYQFSEAERRELLPKIEELVADGGLVWTIDESGFHVYFDAYALMYYAFGPIDADLSFAEYPDLIVPEYRPLKTAESLKDRVEEADAGLVTIPEEVIKTNLYPDLDGNWSDRVSQRAHLSVYAAGNPGQYLMEVRWGSSVSETRVWSCTAYYDKDLDRLTWTDCVCKDVVTDEAGRETETIHYTGGTGTAELSAYGVMTWVEDNGYAPAVCEFVRDQI